MQSAPTQRATEGWGDPVNGIQLHLAVASNATLPPSGDLPPLELQLRNVGQDPVIFSPYAISCGSDVEVDGVLHAPGISAGTGSPAEFPLVPGAVSKTIPVDFFVNKGSHCARPFSLQPGAHSVRIRLYEGVYQQNPAHLRMTISSNVLEQRIAVVVDRRGNI